MTSTRDDSTAGFDGLLEFIRQSRGFDYRGYKRPSLGRRFAKRMQTLRIDSYPDYRAYLEENPDEFTALFDTILINVTSFFRDPATWDFVANEVIPQIVTKKGDDHIRVWSTGCATGEEAYTIAILIAEALGEDEFKRRVKIYATDADEPALRQARHAAYSARDVEPIQPELRARYFEGTDHEYVFKGDLRRCVIFGRHDLVQDPPISRIDLLSSRNTLMYFTSELQQRVIANFHFSLADSGFLLLGKSEMLAARSSLFVPFDLKQRVFTKNLGARGTWPRTAPAFDYDGAGPGDVARQAAFEASPAAQIVVGPDGTLVLANHYARGLLRLGDKDIGERFQDLELSYRPVELRSPLDEAHRERHPIVLRDIEWRADDKSRWLDIHVVPLIQPNGQAAGTSVSFVDVSRFRELSDALDVARRHAETAYEELQSTVEELETTNEELQSTNEELETTNEELQSTNEELETMNEELQSTNEELETINDELQIRTEELNSTNVFLEGILASLGAGVIAVDSNVTITAWNETSEELWGLRASEVIGQNLLGLDVGLPVDQLRKPLWAALDGEHQALELRALNRRGRTVDLRVSVNPLAAPGSATQGAIVFLEAAEAP